MSNVKASQRRRGARNEIRRLKGRDRCSGGRTWWAHFKFTRINIEPIILRKNVWSAPDPQAALIGEEPSAVMYPASE
jgi:hypothetical protein